MSNGEVPAICRRPAPDHDRAAGDTADDFPTEGSLWSPEDYCA